ncbi:hypothetical protein C7S20_15490 [Christiangramia fulva]|uniref:Uncharacterized protein n=1 Tax=Christiangramia fulva TaxID=2126553 RepID=A0A2R3Z8E3_9FLAO|nr:hypothetical protein C7S20_15490 [Christiangramia fulva]
MIFSFLFFYRKTDDKNYFIVFILCFSTILFIFYFTWEIIKHLIFGNFNFTVEVFIDTWIFSVINLVIGMSILFWLGFIFQDIYWGLKWTLVKIMWIFIVAALVTFLFHSEPSLSNTMSLLIFFQFTFFPVLTFYLARNISRVVK